MQKPLLMALLGAGGTGKTTVLGVVEALCEHFFHRDVVAKSAITNTAARILGGNTMHALYKLPLTSLQSKRGRLSDAIRKNMMKSWKKFEASFIDEISFVAPSQFYQANVRAQDAKDRPFILMGGLGTIVAGDFLQMQPVRKLSLAMPIDDVGKVSEEITATMRGTDEVGNDGQASSDARLGFA